MSLYFVTGIAGSGKSQVTIELKARGIEAYDTDDDGLARWRDIKNGYIHPKSSIKQKDRTEEFLSGHEWIVPRSEVEKLAEKAKSKDIYLCGVAYNESQLWDLFKEVFALVIDDDTLKYRLKNRTTNDWGKQPHELQITLGIQQKANLTYKNDGYIVIDATQPINKVVNSILEQSAV